MKKIFFVLCILHCVVSGIQAERYNFNAEWRFALGKEMKGSSSKTDDSTWEVVTLPHAFNATEAFSRNCAELSDTVMWYRKHFVLPASARGKKILVEFEGVRFGARVFLNGKELGWHENGVMAFGMDLTPYIKYGSENVLSVMVDNDWKYKEHLKFARAKDGKEVRSGYQWNDKNFYCNYGGINKNVWLHILNPVYQTLPLYSNLGTTGVYVYASDIDIPSAAATIHAQAQVINSSATPQTVEYRMTLLDNDGKEVASWDGERRSIAAGDTVLFSAEKRLSGLHFWSWGYGYLYTAVSELVSNGKVIDSQRIETGFRKTAFHDGMVYLNDRAIQMKGFAQRSTNEWPAVGISLPAWMSDYSNRLILGCNGNFVRWMHVTPGKQDIRSFDRLGLMMAMPAGDAEKDVDDRRWDHRVMLMRDAIIYNRNNPSIIFYEGGNNQISEEHMAELKAVRDQYDPYGGRAIGSRNMLDSKVAEYGGEMLYINRSATKPMFMMEYNRDEGIRRYWDEWSYPYHKEGEGPLYRGAHTAAYNHNQDGLAVENIIRWNEYFLARPGTGKRVNSGGAKIIFSDSNTHARGEKSYRTSGDVDAMRIAKDSWFCHRVMWNGWVDLEADETYIIGHWNYGEGDIEGRPVVKPVYVCSTGDDVELFLNGKSLGHGERSHTFLFTFPAVAWKAGTLRAVSYREGKEISSYQIETAGKPVALRMHWIEAPELRADGADIRIAEIEAVDKQGRRCPLAHDMLRFTLHGEATWLGGVSGIVSEEEKALNAAAQPEGEEGIIAEGGHSHDTNGILSDTLMLEAGVIRVMVRATTKPGKITLTASTRAYKPVSISIESKACPVQNGFYTDDKGMPVEADWAAALPHYLKHGATPATPSYTDHYTTVPVRDIIVPVNDELKWRMVDDNEYNGKNEPSKWSSDGHLETAWVKVVLDYPAAIRQLVLRPNNFRTTSYPLQVYANGELVWEGYTEKCLGYCYLNFTKTVETDQYEIRMIGPATVKEAFGSMTELAAKTNVSTKAGKSNTLSIIEMMWNK